jgi:ABC-type transport system, involved in lipoprotein release, permease component
MGFGAFSIADLLESQKKAFILLDLLLGLVGSIALTVASLGIVNTMVMSILERTREIGIMKAIGGSDQDVRKIFLVEASLIGLLGGGQPVPDSLVADGRRHRLCAARQPDRRKLPSDARRAARPDPGAEARLKRARSDTAAEPQPGRAARPRTAASWWAVVGGQLSVTSRSRVTDMTLIAGNG